LLELKKKKVHYERRFEQRTIRNLLYIFRCCGASYRMKLHVRKYHRYSLYITKKFPGFCMKNVSATDNEFWDSELMSQIKCTTGTVAEAVIQNPNNFLLLPN
jgi:hypothetical protein